MDMVGFLFCGSCCCGFVFFDSARGPLFFLSYLWIQRQWEIYPETSYSFDFQPRNKKRKLIGGSINFFHFALKQWN